MVSGHTGNVVATSKNTGKIEEIEPGRVHIENESPPSDPELAALIVAWPSLPPAIRAGILAMIQASTPPVRR
jgi:hypothetical protein